MPLRPFAPIALAAVAGAVLSACSMGTNLPASSGSVAGSSSTPPAAVVLLRYDSFEPAQLTVHVGQTVQWQWQESPFAADVTFKRFSSPTMDSGEWSHTFSTPGTFSYRDTLRLEATGVITVLPANSLATPATYPTAAPTTTSPAAPTTPTAPTAATAPGAPGAP